MKKSILCAVLAAFILSAACTAGQDTPALPSIEPYNPGEIAGFYFGAASFEFIPDSGYGTIVPYLGAAAANAESYFDTGRYGFAAADGRIITQPVFNHIEMYEHGGDTVYIAYRETVKADTGKINGYFDYDAVTEKSLSYYIIPADGTDVTQYSEAQFLADGYIAVKRDGLHGVVNMRGETVLPCVYAHNIFYGDGLFVVSDDIFSGYAYVDASGETALTVPYEGTNILWAEDDPDSYAFYLMSNAAFTAGAAPRYENGGYGLINKQGEYIVPPVHTWFQGIYENRAVVFSFEENGGYTSVMYNLDGRELLRAKYIYYNGDGTMYGSFNDYDMFTADLDGEIITVLHGYTFGGGYYYEENSGGEIVVYKNGTRLYAYKTEDGGAAYPSYIGDGLVSFIEYDPNDYTARVTRVLRDDGSIAAEYDGYCYFTPEDGGYSIVCDGKYGVLDAGLDIVIPPEYESLTRYGEYYAARLGRFGGLLDSSGGWIIRVSLLDSLVD